MPQQTYPLRLSRSMREQVERIARKDQVSVNHFIALAVAEKLSRMDRGTGMGMNVPSHVIQPSTPDAFVA